MTEATASPKILIAASGTGGHLFPAIATAEQLSDYQIEWLGVPDRLETELVPEIYPLHTIAFGGIQQRLGFNTLKIVAQFVSAIVTVRRLLRRGKFQGVFTTGGYIAAPAIIAAWSLGLPSVLHESNAIPGKVTRWLSPWCSRVAIGFDAAADFLPQKVAPLWVGTPVRGDFRQALTEAIALPHLPIPPEVPVIVVVGGSQGAVAVNRLVRQAAPAWLEAGIWVVHLTGENDPDAQTLTHPHYFPLPFYHAMAALLQRADFVISRAGSGTLTELAIAATPALLIPYPYAAEDHQSFNAQVFAKAGAAIVMPQADLTPEVLQTKVLKLLQSPEQLHQMAEAARNLAIADSAEQLAMLIRKTFNKL